MEIVYSLSNSRFVEDLKDLRFREDEINSEFDRNHLYCEYCGRRVYALSFDKMGYCLKCLTYTESTRSLKKDL